MVFVLPFASSSKSRSTFADIPLGAFTFLEIGNPGQMSYGQEQLLP
jgi:hypothetical protein